MPELYLDEIENEAPESHWVSVDIAPWMGDLSLKLKPLTRALIDVVEERAKKNDVFNFHKVQIAGKTVGKSGNPALARQIETVKAVIDEWSGVVGDPECNDENKERVAKGQVLLVSFIYEKCSQMAGVKTETETKN